jgi:hypothetical protein
VAVVLRSAVGLVVGTGPIGVRVGVTLRLGLGETVGNAVIVGVPVGLGPGVVAAGVGELADGVRLGVRVVVGEGPVGDGGGAEPL